MPKKIKISRKAMETLKKNRKTTGLRKKTKTKKYKLKKNQKLT